MKTYLDPIRVAKIKEFGLRVDKHKLQPYYRLIEENICSVPLLVQAYHHFLHHQYFHRSKVERYHAFRARLNVLLDKNPLSAGAYLMRTALLEGAVPKPSFSLSVGLQSIWANILAFYPQGDNLLLRYWEPLCDYFEAPDDGSMDSYHLCTASRLAFLRNQIFQYVSQDDIFFDFRERFLLWYELLSYDQGEVDHLASLDYNVFLSSDYWIVFSRHFKYQWRYRCALCSRSRNIHVHHHTYQFRGQEIIFPHCVACLCSDCHKHVHDLMG